LGGGRVHNEIVQALEASLALDREQLSDITMDDEDLMREVLGMLWEDTVSHIEKLEAAIRNREGEQCARLAHYSKGACANLGANAAAAVFRRIEIDARAAQFGRCVESLTALGMAMEELKLEIAAF
jgi:HPt (histidine-containing phosphotransfer) domain-containing protein